MWPASRPSHQRLGPETGRIDSFLPIHFTEPLSTVTGTDVFVSAEGGNTANDGRREPQYSPAR